MNDRTTLENEVRAALGENAPAMPPNHLLQSLEFNARRKRRYPRWLALIKEPTMRTDSHLVAGSPTARVAAIVIATLLLAAGVIGASFAGAQLLAADGPIVVDADGGGDYTTIQEAVAAAADGDEILIKPGTYSGPVDIDKDIAIRGEDRQSVVLEFGFGCTVEETTDVTTCPDESWLYDQFLFDPWPYGVALIETDAVLSDLTIRKSEDVGGSGFVVRGGSPHISGITYTGESDFGNVYVHGGSMATISDSEFGPMWVFFEEVSPATIENSSTDGVIRLHTNSRAPTETPQTVRGNRAGEILIRGAAVVEGNVMHREPDSEEEDEDSSDAINVSLAAADILDNEISGYDNAIVKSGPGTVRGNILTDNGVGIDATSTEHLTIADNVLSGNDTGVVAWGAGEKTIEGNSVTGGNDGMKITGGGGSVAGNTIDGVSGRGLSISGNATPTVDGNVACGNGEDLFVGADAEPAIEDDNEFCTVTQQESPA